MYRNYGLKPDTVRAGGAQEDQGQQSLQTKHTCDDVRSLFEYNYILNSYIKHNYFRK